MWHVPSTAALWICSKCLFREFICFKPYSRVFATTPAADMAVVVAVTAAAVFVVVVVQVVTGPGILITAVQLSY